MGSYGSKQKNPQETLGKTKLSQGPGGSFLQGDQTWYGNQTQQSQPPNKQHPQGTSGGSGGSTRQSRYNK